MIIKNRYNDISFFQGNNIVDIITLSNSFGVNCNKVKVEKNKHYVVKELIQINNTYNSVYYEGKCLEFLNGKFSDLFPQVFYLKDNILVMEFIEHNNVRNRQSEQDLAQQISKIHKIKNDKFGYEFNTPIGGLKQPSHFGKSWVDFYGNKRLNMIFELINTTNPMPNEINRGIEKLLKNEFKKITEISIKTK